MSALRLATSHRATQVHKVDFSVTVVRGTSMRFMPPVAKREHAAGEDLRRTVLLAAIAFNIAIPVVAPQALAQANGKLQIHFMNVGQGDGALVVSPGGETVLVDNGVRNLCERPVSYLEQLGIKSIDYQIVSHFHDDHIGCTKDVLNAFPLRRASYDRGSSYESGTFDDYLAAIGNLRKEALPGSAITLDSGSAHPVTITFVVANGIGRDGTRSLVKNENDQSVVAVLHFGMFDAVFGGDLSGQRTSNYRDVETNAAHLVGQVEVYKVNHHGSQYSSNDAWMTAIKPAVAIISAGEKSKHKHPTVEAIARIHGIGAKTYWTTAGAEIAKPESGRDVVGGNIIVEVAVASPSFSVTYHEDHSGARVDTYRMWETPADAVTVPTYAWSKLSDVYHYSHCSYVKNISPENLVRGDTPPAGKRLSKSCQSTP